MLWSSPIRSFNRNSIVVEILHVDFRTHSALFIIFTLFPFCQPKTVRHHIQASIGKFSYTPRLEKFEKKLWNYRMVLLSCYFRHQQRMITQWQWKKWRRVCSLLDFLLDRKKVKPFDFYYLYESKFLLIKDMLKS